MSKTTATKKTVLILAFALSSSALATGQTNPETGPFGFHRGMTRDEIIHAVGVKAVDVKHHESDDYLVVTTAPKPYVSFESYGLLISPAHGLLKIRAIGKDIRTNGYGSEVRTEFEEILHGLTNVYGKPTDGFDFLQVGSIWHEPREWMTALEKKERHLMSYWKTGTLPNQIALIAVEANSLSDETGYIDLNYEFNGFTEYETKKRSDAANVF